MKKLFSVMLSLSIIFSLCASAMAESRIAVNLKTLSSEYWRTVKSGCDRAAEELGVMIEVQGPSSESAIQEQVDQIETMLAGNPDAIIIAPDDGDAVIGTLISSGYTGPVFFCDTECDYEAKISFIGTSNRTAAYEGGVYGVSIKGEATRALIIYGQEGDNTSNLRKEGYEQALKEAGLEPVAEVSGNNTTDGAMKVMENQLLAHPDINLVLCHNDDTAIGALNACQQAGITGVTIIGFDGNKSAIELIASGDLNATVAQQPELMGYLSVETALKYLSGEEVESNIDVSTVIIDGKNCADYLS